MPKIVLPFLIAGLLVVVFATEQSPYTGMEERPIKALSPDEIAGYLEGHGMGFAMPAELNSYPGPKHVLELADDLELSGEQRVKTQAIFDAMHADAVELGARFVDRERNLDRMFASGQVDDRTLREAVAELGQIRAEIRYAHLAAHLRMRELLSPEQVARYDRLRGYGNGGHHDHQGHHGHHDHHDHHDSDHD